MLGERQYQREREKLLASAPIPVYWLVGKTGSGKTSIVHFLTGADEAEIGNGFQPQTTTSMKYDFPSTDTPLLRFLDTRGLGEVSYDPLEDIREFNELAHVVIVVVRLTDHALDELLATVRTIRRAKPHRPVVLAITCLHEAYPGQQHPDPDPFGDGLDASAIPPEVSRALARQQQQFGDLVDRIVPIDLTKAEDGFLVRDFGGKRLHDVLLELLPASLRQTFASLDESMRQMRSLNDRRAAPYVVSYSVLAATAAGAPLPWIDIPFVVAIQTHLVLRLRSLYGAKVDGGAVRRLMAATAARLVTRLVVRGPLKAVPFVGMAASATLGFAYTYGLGRACCWYFGQVQAGNAPTEAEIRRVWREEISLARKLWKGHPGDDFR